MVKRIAVSWALLAVAAAAGCATIAGLDGNYHSKGTSGGAGTAGDTAGSAGAGGNSGAAGTANSGSGAGPACVLLEAPDPPAVADDGGDLDFVVAMHSIELDEQADDVTLGLDLDGLCTCTESAPGSCTPLADLVCDGPGGMDNAVGIVFSQVYNLSSGIVTSGQLSAAANQGQWTNLLRIRGYNGKADDAKVEGLVYTTQGVNATPPMPVPKWDGNDAWPVDQTSLINPANLDSAKIVSAEGYVAGGVLVVRFPEVPIRLRSPVFTMTLDIVDMMFTANLEPSPTNGYRLTKGVGVGKWPLVNAFKGLSSMRYALNQKLCTDYSNYAAIKAGICAKADLRVDAQPGSCDALSVGVAFTSDSAKLGAVVAGEAPPKDSCDPIKDPANDSCN